MIKLVGGTQPPRSLFAYEPKKGYIRLLQIRDFENDDNVCYVKNNQKLSKCESDDIMIARYGASLGRILRGKSGAHNVAIVRTIFDKKQINPNFFFYWLNSHPFQSHVRKIGDRVAQSGFNKNDFNRLKIPLPPIQKQQKIASILSNIDSMIQQIEKLIEQTKCLKQHSVDELTIKGINHSNFKKTILGRSFLKVKIPEEWDVKKLKEFAKVHGRIGWKNLRLDEYTDSGPMMLSVWSMPDDVLYGIDYDTGIVRLSEFRYQESPEIQLKNGDVLISKDGANIGKVGIVKKLPERATVNSHVAVIRPIKDHISGDFLYWFLKSKYFQKYCKSSITGTGTPGFSQDNLRKSKIPIPELQEQEKISKFLFEFEIKINLQKNKKIKLELLKKGLMQKLLVGQIWV